MGRSIFNHLKDPLIGAEIQQRYQVVRHIGSGAVVDVYLARQRTLGGRQVALRFLKPALAERDEADGGVHRKRFFHEIQLACLFKGPSFARIIDGGISGPGPRRPFVVQELLEGAHLSELVADGPLPWREAAVLVLQLSMAVEELHGYGVLYRDFSPSNVIVEEQRGVGRMARIFDFSHATLEGVAVLDDQDDQDLAGSPVYSAPELGCTGVAPGRSVDTFSLGALLYLACTARAPVHLPSPGDWAGWRTWIDEGRPVPEIPFKEAAPKAPAALARLVHKALNPSPDARIAEAAEFSAALRKVLGIKVDAGTDLGGFSIGNILGRLKR